MAVHHDRRRDGARAARPGPVLAQGRAIRAHRESRQRHDRPVRTAVRHVPAYGAGRTPRADTESSPRGRRPPQPIRRRKGRALSLAAPLDAGAPVRSAAGGHAVHADASFIETQFPVSRLSKVPGEGA